MVVLSCCSTAAYSLSSSLAASWLNEATEAVNVMSELAALVNADNDTGAANSCSFACVGF